MVSLATTAPEQVIRERGFVLLLVLGILMLLTILGSSLYLIGQSERWGFVALRQESSATQRANMGAQAALAKLRANTVDLSALTVPQADYATAYNGGNYVRLPPVADAAGVVEYQSDIFLKTGSGSSSNFTIHSTGFSADANSPNLMTSVYEVDLVTASSSNAPTDGYAGGG